MLSRDSGPVETYAFLIAVEIEKDGRNTSEQVLERLKGSLYWMEGIGEVEAECLGIITTYPEPDVKA
jgi:hypothetical protein